MRILLIIYGKYPSKNGVAVVTQYLAEGMQTKGNSVCVMSLRQEGDEYESVINGVRVVRFNVKYSLLKRPCGELGKIEKYIRDSEYDVVVFECMQTPFVDYLLPKLKTIPSTMVLHSHDFSGLYLSSFKWKGDLRNTIANSYNYFIWKNYYSNFVSKYINNFHSVICLADICRDYSYLERYYSGQKCVLSNAVEEIFFDEEVLRSNTNEKGINKYLISVANYGNIKNQIGILKEYYRSRSSQEYAMVFCGSTNNEYYRKILKEKKKLDGKFGMRTVQFLVGLERKKIPALMKNASLYLCGSYWEAYSVSLIEAMATGTPFISTDVGNAKKLPGGKTVDTIKDMHDQIDFMLSDQRQLDQYIADGKRYVDDNCRMSHVVDKFETMIIEACEEHNGK